ncbi:molybdopterin-binding domain-containing protein [Lacunimicrobium album]
MTSPALTTYFGCSLLCDEVPCAKCLEWKKQLEAEATVEARFRVREKDVTLENAVAEVRKLLHDAQRPVIFADGHLASAQGHLLVDLAAREHAILTTQCTSADAELTGAMARRGASTCTLGEVSQRADVVVFWNVGSEAIEQIGQRLGTRKRTVFSVGTPGIKDLAQQTLVTPDINCRKADDLLTSIQLLLNGKKKDASPDVLLLVDVLLAADYPVIFVGDDDPSWQTPSAMRQLVDVHLMLREKNRAFLLAMPHQAVALTVGNVLLSRTGYGDAVDFASVGKQMTSDLSVEALLKEGDVDLLILISDRDNERLNDLVSQSGRTLKIVRLSPEMGGVAEVVIGTSRADVASYVLRFDGVPVPVRNAENSTVSPRLTEILTNLLT